MPEPVARSLVAYDIYPVDDPIDGTRLVRLTEDDCASGTIYRKTLRGTGSGRIILHADHAAVTAGHFAEGNYVRVVEVSTGYAEKVIGGFWLKDGDEVLISRREGGGEGRALGGPGTLDIFRRATFPRTLRSTVDASLGEHQHYLDINGYLRFTGPETYGGIMGRVFAEAQLDVPTAFPPGMPSHTWDDVNDSNGDPWTVFDGYYDVGLGDNVLDIFLDLMRKGIDLVIDPDTFEVAAYLAGSYGDDLTGAFGASTVRFEKTVNIRADLSKAIHQLPYASHVLAIGEDGFTKVERIDPDYSSGDLVVKDTIHVPGTNDGDILAEAAVESIRLRKLAVAEARFPIKGGKDPANGLYLAGRHFDAGDLVTLHTGTDPNDYDETPIQVAAIEWQINDSRGHDVNVELGAQYIDSATAAELRSLTTIIREPGTCNCLQFCTPGYPGDAGSTRRLYYSNALAGFSPLPAGDATWNSGDGPSAWRLLKTTADGTIGHTGSGSTWSATGVAADDYSDIPAFAYQITDSDLLASIQAGGMSFTSFIRSRSRSGIGINEASQENYAQGVVRIYRVSGNTFIGTALAAHSTHTLKFKAQTTHTSREFGGTLAAVPGAALNDWIIWEPGTRHVNPTSGGTGSAIMFTNDAADDLPAEQDVSSPLNAWVDLSTATSGATEGCPILDTVLQGAEQEGDSPFVPHWDHQHAHGLISVAGPENYHSLGQISNYIASGAAAPTTGDDEDDGWRIGTHWLDTSTGDIYIATDVTAGAAVWEQINGGGGGGAPTTADYLVGTAQGALSAEIVVGTTPGGELGNTWASPTVDATHAGSNHLQPVRKNSAGTVFTRRQLNLIEGSNVTLTVADDAGNDEVDITIAAAAGSLTVEEEDASPSVGSVSKIQVPNGSLTNDGGGTVSLSYAAASHSHGGADLEIPTLFQSTKASADTPDDEFDGTSLNGKWTKVDGTETGIGNLLASTGAGLLEVGERPGWLAMQVGTAAGDSVELRQDYTLPDGACIVAYMSVPIDWSAAAVANNEIWAGIGVNDNDTGIFSGTSGQTAHMLFDTDVGGYRLIGLSATTPTYIGINNGSADSFANGGFFFRIDRSGLNYDLFWSIDGFSWNYVGRKTMATAANNVWLWAWCNATMGQRMTVWVPWIRQGTALAHDPWTL